VRSRHPWVQSSAINVEDDENVPRRKNPHQKENEGRGSRMVIPSFVYYSGHKHGQLQTTTNPFPALTMTQALAEQLTAKLNVSGVEATVCDLFADLDTVIYDILVDIGEEADISRDPQHAR
jgi:hypothetical protein